MTDAGVGVKVPAGQRVVLTFDAPAPRWIGALAVLIVLRHRGGLCVPSRSDAMSSSTYRDSTVGRKCRHRRQAVSRTRNAGATSELFCEQAIDDGLLAELVELVRASRRGARRSEASR